MTTHAMTFVAAALLLSTGAAHAMTDAELQAIVDQRLAGDRTGACMAVAVVDAGKVARSFRCADAAAPARIGPDSAFEIGSVSKTMTATLLADLIVAGKASLDDPLSAYLPEGTAEPAFEGKSILLRHVVTHTSGLPALPPGVAITNPGDPYAGITADALLESLGRTTLSQAPGSSFAYSNFASMVLSYAVARRAGMDLETLLRTKLFTPLGMEHAYVGAVPKGVRAAVGHTPNGAPTPAWTFTTDLAGVGGVRATLVDMVRYVEANLDPSRTPLKAAIALAHQQVNTQPPMAMNWMLAPVGGRTVLVHEGGTGGFSSFVSVDTTRQRGVVILSDTTWNSIGSLGSLGMHLVDASLPLGKPRKLATPPQSLLEGLAGDYQLQGAMKMRLRHRDGTLYFHPEGQAEYALAYDDAGDFFPTIADAVLRPQKKANGEYTFTWRQGGGVIPATRLAREGAKPVAAAALSKEALAGYAGVYTLAPGFALTVRAGDGTLHAQATGQGEFALEAGGKDSFAAPGYGIEIVFKRGPDGSVESLDLHQGGRVLPGRRDK